MTEQPDRPEESQGSDPGGPPEGAPEATEESAAPEADTSNPEHHHTIREELEVLRDEARVDSYRWGATIMWIVLAVILIGIAVAGLIWLL